MPRATASTQGCGEMSVCPARAGPPPLHIPKIVARIRHLIIAYLAGRLRAALSTTFSQSFGLGVLLHEALVRRVSA